MNYLFYFFLVEHHGNLTQEQRLLDHLLQNYRTRRLIRPVKDLSKPIVIDFSAELVGVAKVVRKMYKFKKELEKILLLRMRMRKIRLSSNPSHVLCWSANLSLQFKMFPKWNYVAMVTYLDTRRVTMLSPALIWWIYWIMQDEKEQIIKTHFWIRLVSLSLPCLIFAQHEQIIIMNIIVSLLCSSNVLLQFCSIVIM